MRVRITAIAGAAAAAGLTAALLLTAPAQIAAQPNPPGPPPPGAPRGVGKPERPPMQMEQLHARVAANLGVTPERLEQAFKQARKDLVTEQLQQGRITQEQADRMIARIEQGPQQHGQRGKPNQPGAQDGQPKQGQPGARVSGPQGRAVTGFIAQSLGMAPKDLRDALQSGKTLVQIAAEKGMSADQLRSTILGQLEQRLNMAIQQGSLSAEQAAQVRQRNQRMVDQLISGGPRRDGAGPRQPRVQLP